MQITDNQFIIQERYFFLLVLNFTLLILTQNLFSQNMEIIPQAEGILIQENQQKVLFYQQKTKSLNGKAPRANYIHPLYDLQGNELTEDFPADHLHHRGIFWAWHQILLNNQKIADGWDCKNIEWNVEKLKYDLSKKGVLVQTKVFWEVNLDTSKTEKTKIIQEEAKILIHPLQNNYRIIDFDIQLEALKTGVKIGGSEDAKGYGGFSVRVKLPEDIQFIYQNKEITPQDTAIKAGNYLSIKGNFNGQKVTYISILCHPDYPKNNQTWILRKKASLQNPVFPGRNPIEMPKNQVLSLKYRLIIHENPLDLEKIYQNFLKNSQNK